MNLMVLIPGRGRHRADRTAFCSGKIAREYERGVIFRLAAFSRPRVPASSS